DVIVRNILDRKQKALVIYGGAHFIPGLDFSRKVPLPGSEAVLRKLYADAAVGVVDETLISPTLLEIARRQSKQLLAELTQLGPIQSLTFFGGDENGRDTYTATFQNGQLRRTTIQLDGAGKMSDLTRYAIDRQPTDGIRTGVEKKYPGVWYIVSPYTGFMT